MCESVEPAIDGDSATNVEPDVDEPNLDARAAPLEVKRTRRAPSRFDPGQDSAART